MLYILCKCICLYYIYEWNFNGIWPQDIPKKKQRRFSARRWRAVARKLAHAIKYLITIREALARITNGTQDILADGFVVLPILPSKFGNVDNRRSTAIWPLLQVRQRQRTHCKQRGLSHGRLSAQSLPSTELLSPFLPCFTTFMCRLSRNSGASTSWNPKGLSRPVTGKLYLYPLYLYTKDLISVPSQERLFLGSNQIRALSHVTH